MISAGFDESACTIRHFDHGGIDRLYAIPVLRELHVISCDVTLMAGLSNLCRTLFHDDSAWEMQRALPPPSRRGARADAQARPSGGQRAKRSAILAARARPLRSVAPRFKGTAGSRCV